MYIPFSRFNDYNGFSTTGKVPLASYPVAIAVRISGEYALAGEVACFNSAEMEIWEFVDEIWGFKGK